MWRESLGSEHENLLYQEFKFHLKSLGEGVASKYWRQKSDMLRFIFQKSYTGGSVEEGLGGEKVS